MPANIVAQLARRIRKQYPHLKFRIKRSRLADAFATTHLRAESGTYIITIDKDVKPDLAAFLLCHEIAHGISWHSDAEEHGDGFWAAYRQVYRLYEDFTAG